MTAETQQRPDTGAPGGPPAGDAIAVTAVRKRYGDLRVLEDVSFRVRAGEIFALLGPNGAGKTTLVEILIGYGRRDGGDVRVLGVDPAAGARRLAPRLGVMLQDGGINPGLTVREAVVLFSKFVARPLPVDDVLARVGLDTMGRRLVRHLSGGERQRLSLGAALVGNPDLIFLDEPTVGMDAAVRRATWDTVRALAADGVTVFLTTHLLHEAEAVADRVAILTCGRIRAMDTPRRLAATVTDGAMFACSEPIDAPALAAHLCAHVITEPGAHYRVDGPLSPEGIASLAAWLSERDVLLTELRSGAGTLEEAYLRLIDEAGDPE